MIVGIGGALGSMLRYGITLITGILMISSTFATLFVNSAGSLIIGIILAVCEKSSWYLFAAIGFCGGFTTFSTFSSQTLELFQTGKTATGLLYIFITLVLCLLFVWIGFSLGKNG